MSSAFITPVPHSKVHKEMTDPGPGEHLWTTLIVYRVSDDAIKALNEGRAPGPQLLDHENLLTAEGPGCYKCEEPYSKRIALRKCTGSMELAE